jgi:hypothetical protein
LRRNGSKDEIRGTWLRCAADGDSSFFVVFVRNAAAALEY